MILKVNVSVKFFFQKYVEITSFLFTLCGLVHYQYQIFNRYITQCLIPNQNILVSEMKIEYNPTHCGKDLINTAVFSVYLRRYKKWVFNNDLNLFCHKILLRINAALRFLMACTNPYYWVILLGRYACVARYLIKVV